MPMPYGETDYPKTKRARERLFEQIIGAGRAGKSHTQIAEMIGISRDTLKLWLGDHLELNRVMCLADDYALAWWEGLGQRQAESKEGNSSVFMFIMKNRFDRDYGQDAMTAYADPGHLASLAGLSAETRNKLRALLREEVEKLQEM